MQKQPLESLPVPTNLKLSLLWASLMSLYIYNDYFSLFLPGTVEDMLNGRIGPLGEATEPVLVGVSIMLAIPALMIVLSAVLPATASKWLNIVMGAIYTLIQLMTFFGSALFYQIVVVLEIGVTGLIVWYAWRWPRAGAPG